MLPPAGSRAGGETTLNGREQPAHQALTPPLSWAQGTLRRRLVPRVNSFGRNDRSLAHWTAAARFPLCARADEGGEWLGWGTAGNRALRRPPAQHVGVGGGARRRWRWPGDGCSRAGCDCRFYTSPPRKADARSHHWEPEQGRGFLSQPQAPACQPQ